jgi:hypothetical protein
MAAHAAALMVKPATVMSGTAGTAAAAKDPQGGVRQ